MSGRARKRSGRTLGVAWADVYLARSAFEKLVRQVAAGGGLNRFLAELIVEKLDAVEAQLLATADTSRTRAERAQAGRAARRIIDDIGARAILEEERAQQVWGYRKRADKRIRELRARKTQQ